MTSKPAEIYKRDAAAFAVISDEERRKILDSVVEPDVLYRIPRMEGTGHQIILEDIHYFQSKWPGGHFALYSASQHHDVALMEWQLILSDGTPSVRGHDSIRITPEGKIAQIITFAPSTLEPQAS
jgi:hypothetical protein